MGMSDWHETTSIYSLNRARLIPNLRTAIRRASNTKWLRKLHSETMYCGERLFVFRTNKLSHFFRCETGSFVMLCYARCASASMGRSTSGCHQRISRYRPSSHRKRTDRPARRRPRANNRAKKQKPLSRSIFARGIEELRVDPLFI